MGIVDGVLEYSVLVNGLWTGQIQFANGIVLQTAHEGPQSVAANAEGAVDSLFVFQTSHQLVPFDFKVGGGGDPELVVLEVAVVGGYRTHVVEQAVNAVRRLAVEQTSTLANVLQVAHAGAEQSLANQIVVRLGVVGQDRVVLRSLKAYVGVQIQQLTPAGEARNLIQTVPVQARTLRGEGSDVAVLENVVAQAGIPRATEVPRKVYLYRIVGIANEVSLFSGTKVLRESGVGRHVAVHGVAVVVPVGQGIGEAAVHAVVPNKATAQNNTGGFAGFDVDVVGGTEFIGPDVQTRGNGFQRIATQQLSCLNGSQSRGRWDQRTILQTSQYVFFNTVYTRSIRTTVLVEFVFRRQQKTDDGTTVFVLDDGATGRKRAQVVPVGIDKL